MQYPALAHVMVPAFSLLHGHAGCERAFSVIRKMHIECRQSFNADTLTTLLQCKLKDDRSSYELNVSEEMVALAKRTTHEYNIQHQKNVMFGPTYCLHNKGSRDQCEYMVLT